MTATPDVWIVTHCELSGCLRHPYLDSLTFHVAASRRAAVAYLGRQHASAHSWWELRRFAIDCREPESDEVSIAGVEVFDHRGKRVAEAPWPQARKAMIEDRDQQLELGLLTPEQINCPRCRGEAPQTTPRPRRRAP